uniref:NADH dehydrogenase subunit 4 n=1 Tax=Leocrates chinensis TaxID=378359 RepID=UPI0021D52041|nr:NADH dehydrogenase subunit 4 [Leocrates chinensis]UXC96465.1 NADH dehydrogenase subunit 4 [Leocrates chinensis]
MLKLTFMCSSLLLLPKSSMKLLWTSAPCSLMILALYSLTLNSNSMMTPKSIYFLSLDSLSSPLISLTLWISALMILASTKIITSNQSPRPFTFYIMLLNIILILAFLMNNMLSFYIMFELSLIPTLMLILGWGYQPERLQAGMYLMMYTITASLPLLISMMLLYNNNFHLSFSILNWSSPILSHPLIPMWWFMTITAFMVKMPIYMTHLWLPKAHVEAPVAGSMILAGLLLKLGSYGFARVSSMFIWVNSSLTPFISSLALWGACITSMICLRQTDMKSLIAYSSVGHMGILMAGLMSNSPWGWEGALLMMIAHGLSSSGLFAIANMMYEMTQTRSLYLVKGMLALFPTMTLLWFLLTAANMAAPPTINLLSEIILIASSLFISSSLTPAIAILSFLGAAYSLILYTSSQHGHPSLFPNSLNLFNQRNMTIILLHIIPIFIIILIPSSCTSWI